MPRSLLQITIVPLGAAVTLRVETHSPRVRQEEVAAFDGWQSDEEERIFLDSEVSNSSSDEDDDRPRPAVRRHRWCLPGCDCERPVGSRKCYCERKGDNYCGKNCQCDPSMCRARPKDEPNSAQDSEDD